MSGDFICFLDADDLYASCFLEALIKPMIEKDLDVAWCDIQCFFGEKPKSDKKSLSEPVFVDDIFAALINKKPNPQSITPNNCVLNKNKTTQSYARMFSTPQKNCKIYKEAGKYDHNQEQFS